MFSNRRVVISKYKEDVSWVKDLQCDYVIYNKDNSITDYNAFSLRENGEYDLCNVGREGHTYLFHILKNYDNLRNFEIFVHGNPFDHFKDFISFANSKFLPEVMFLTECKLAYSGFPEEKSIHNVYRNGQHPFGCYDIREAQGLDANSVISKATGLEIDKRNHEAFINAQFCVHRDVIKKWSKEVYKDMLINFKDQNRVNNCSTKDGGMEFTWPQLFCFL